MSNVSEDMDYSQSVSLTNSVENILELLNAISNSLWDLIVGIPKLDLLEYRKRNGIYEDDATINTRSVDDQDLLVALLQREESRLCIVECLCVVEMSKVLATLIRTDC